MEVLFFKFVSLALVANTFKYCTWSNLHKLIRHNLFVHGFQKVKVKILNRMENLVHSQNTHKTSAFSTWFWHYLQKKKQNNNFVLFLQWSTPVQALWKIAYINFINSSGARCGNWSHSSINNCRACTCWCSRATSTSPSRIPLRMKRNEGWIKGRFDWKLCKKNKEILYVTV